MHEQAWQNRARLHTQISDTMKESRQPRKAGNETGTVTGRIPLIGMVTGQQMGASWVP